MSEYTYELKNPFEYALKGENQTAGFITMTAPGYKQIGKITPIKQAFMAAATEVTKGIDAEQKSDAEQANEDDGDGETTGPQVMQIMYRWSGDLAKIFMYAAELFKSGVVELIGPSGTNFTKIFTQAAIMDDPESNAATDGNIELEFRANPAQ